MLALRDHRRRILGVIGDQQHDATLVAQLLAIDPPSLARCMRALYAPIHGHRPHIVSIPELVERLGVSLVKRALQTAPIHPAGSTRIRELWLHSIATAVAERELATAQASLDPERAYVLGLLHDLHGWRDEIAAWRGSPAAATSTSPWHTRWHLPMELGAEVDAGTNDGHSLLLLAKELATRAGFPDPRHRTPDPAQELRVASMEDLIRANRLRGEVERRLARFNLQATPNPDLDPPGTGDDSLFATRSVGRIAALCTNLAAGHRHARARALLTASTSATLRYLDFDRAFAVRWVAGLHRCWIRQKADLTPRALQAPHVTLSVAEQRAFTTAIGSGQPQLLTHDGGEVGLQAMLGNDEALLVPLNVEFQVPTLLVLDRSLSGGAIDLRNDVEPAAALTNVVSLLQENLLLNRQRSRAVKFSLTDPLTRLANRSYGLSVLRQEISRAMRTGVPLTVLMMDLDRFKHLNDEYGHVVGDQALRTAGEVLHKAIRRMDTAVRYGGEEFLAILPSTAIEEAAVIATRLQTAVAAAGDDLSLPITISIGVASFIPGEDTVESLLSRADRALYASKDRGRNRFSVDVEGTLAT